MPQDVSAGPGTDGTIDAATRRCRVLAIDDNADIRESLAVVIRLLGHEVAIAGDGEHGLAAARDLRPELVLLDVSLPGMDGYAVARALRAEPWAAQTLLVAMTGWARESDRQRATEAGFDTHVAKPVDLRTLKALIERAAGTAAA